MLISTDPAHNLSDAFAQQFTGEPVSVNGCSNLYACEVDPEATMKSEMAYFEDPEVQKSPELSEFQSFITSLPGIDEAMALSSVLNYFDKNTEKAKERVYDIVIFDTAPTGHTLRLLQLPGILKLGLEKLTSWKTKFGTMLSSITSMISSDSKPTQQQNVKKLEEKMKIWLEGATSLNNLFRNQKTTQFVCVCNASFLSVYETKRLVNELKVANIATKYVIVNMLMPRMLGHVEPSKLSVTVEDILRKSNSLEQSVIHSVKNAIELCSGVSKMQEHSLDVLLEDKDISTVLLPLMAGEIRGLQRLIGFSERLLHMDPSLVLNAQDSTEVQNFSRIDFGSNVEGNYVAATKAKVLKATITFVPGETVKITGMIAQQDLHNKTGLVRKIGPGDHIEVEIEGNSYTILANNLEKTKASNEDKSAPSVENITPEMISLVQNMLMQPGGLQILLEHDLVQECINSGDEDMVPFFNDLKRDGLLAGFQYLSNKAVMSKLANIAKRMTQ